MGVNRDLKKATENYWAGKTSLDDLLGEGKRLRLEHWQIQKKAGVDIIPSNDFAFYDQVLDHIQLFGVSDPWALTRSKILADPSDRSSLSDIPNTISTRLMNTSPWAVVFRSLRRMDRPLLTFLAW